MEQQTIQQIRGMSELITETIDATVHVLADVHEEIAHQPYAVLAHIDAVAIPSQGIEDVQETITYGVYSAIRAVNHLVALAATYACDRLEERRKRTE